MSKSEVQDLLDAYLQVGAELDSISSDKRMKPLSDKEAAILHKREFELCMVESNFHRKILSLLENLQDDVRNRFFIQRIKKSLKKRVSS